MKALAVDLGGSHATCALVEDGTLVTTETVAAKGTGGLRSALADIERAIQLVLDRAGARASQCAGVAFSFCGLVDTDHGRILSTNAKYDDGPSLDLPGWCQSAFGLPVKLENDARLALLGEWHAGAARGHDDVVMMTLGTGIGGAAMLGGRLLRGRHYQAGCLGGHLPVAFEGRRCTCGAIGCAEAEASSVALPEVCRATDGFEVSALAREPRLTYEALFRHAVSGDSVALQVRDRCLHVWATAAIGMIHAYDPEMLILGGGVMRSGATVLPFIQSYVGRHAWTPWGKVEVRCAALGEHAALLGAIPLLTREGL